MKKLIFVRHAKAEIEAPGFSDFERSLTPKGKYIAKVMARKLTEKENSPGIIMTSPAFRALETAYIFMTEFGIRHEKAVVNSNLYYMLNFTNFLKILSLVNEETETITLFGHNPSFSEITNDLCKGGCDLMPKCGVVGITFSTDSWLEIRRDSGKLEYFLKPE
jgi:phosphohistidine phosphatase